MNPRMHAPLEQLNDFDVQSWRLRLQCFGSLVPPRAAAALIRPRPQRQRQVNLAPKDAVSCMLIAHVFRPERLCQPVCTVVYCTSVIRVLRCLIHATLHCTCGCLQVCTNDRSKPCIRRNVKKKNIKHKITG